MVTLPQLPSRLLCQTFSRQAQKIWEDLSRAQAQGRNRNEETITDDFLDDVQNQHPQEVATFQFNKRDEQFTGADWEWWLTNDRVWLGLLVQAKRLRRHSHKYGIKHWVASGNMWQMELLLQQARWKGVDPLYCFYNYDSSWPNHLTWNCCTTHDLPLFGCTVAHAAAVKNQLYLGGAGLPKMSTVSYPLSCLVCCTRDAQLSPHFFEGQNSTGGWRVAATNSRITSSKARVRGSELPRKRSRHAQCRTLRPSVRPL